MVIISSLGTGCSTILDEFYILWIIKNLKRWEYQKFKYRGMKIYNWIIKKKIKSCMHDNWI